MDDKIAALIQRFQQLRGGLRPGNRNAFAGGSSTFREGGRAIPTGPIGDFVQRLPPGANPYPQGLGPSANNAVNGLSEPGGSGFGAINAPGGMGYGSRFGGNMPPPNARPMPLPAPSGDPGWATTDMGMTPGFGGGQSGNAGASMGSRDSIGIPWNASMGGASGPPQLAKTLADIMRAGVRPGSGLGDQPVSPWGSGGPMRSRQ